MANKKTETKATAQRKAVTVGAACEDSTCHIHGGLRLRGRTFKGKVISKFPKRVAIEFERMIYVRKYERYSKSRTKIHARVPKCMEDLIKIGDLISVQECRPLSKIIHFAVVSKIKDADDKGLEVKKK